MTATKVAIIGSGNIGTDLLIKILRRSKVLEVAAMVGIDPASDGLARAARLGVAITADGVEGLIAMDVFDDIRIVFDATSAGAHRANAAGLAPYGKQLVDLTPAAIGPYTVPAVNLGAHLDAPNVNMVTCGGQATIPIVAAVATVTPVHYAEIIASIASKSAGPGTRANIDEFTETMLMRDTVLCLTSRLDAGEREKVTAAVGQMVADVAEYVPGYRLKQPVQFSDTDPGDQPATLTEYQSADGFTQVSVFLEVEGAAHYLPAYAGNLDIMTSAAVRVGEQLAAHAATPQAETPQTTTAQTTTAQTTTAQTTTTPAHAHGVRP
jgi:acetaldehyde dehydrogenase